MADHSLTLGVDGSRALRARRTGTEHYSLQIIRHLLALPEAGAHTWRLYVDQDPGDLFPQQPNLTLRHLPTRRLWTHRSLGREIRRFPPDVLFVPAHVIPLAWPSRLPPSVVTLHDLGYRYFPATYPLGQRLYLEWSSRWSAYAARQVIAVSRATGQDLVTHSHTDPAKIQVIHEAATPGGPSPSPAEQTATLARYGIHRPYAFFLSTLQPRKNVDRLLSAYIHLLEREQIGWDLLLAGDGGLRDALQRRVQERGLTDRVHLPGYVPETDLPALFGGARFFCYPSLFEGFGLPVLEAQQYGVAVMTANNSALPEVAGDGAILVDPTDVEALADAMLKLSQDEGLRQRLIAKGHENVQRFSWVRAAQETLAVLEAVAGKK